MDLNKSEIYINIITPKREGRYMRQLPVEYAERGIFFFENSEDKRLWDYVIIHDDLDEAMEVDVRPGGLVLLAGEPEITRYYGKHFIRQFDWAITTHKYLKKCPNHIFRNIALNWHFGFKHSDKSCIPFNKLCEMQPPVKTKNISVITSSLNLTPGHVKRLKVLNDLKLRYPTEIDFFGKGINFIDDKADALLPYRFHICIENSISPHYWSEKLADPLLGFSVPIYYGDPLAEEYFSRDSLIRIDLNNKEDLFKKIDLILDNPQKIYNQYFPRVVEAREKLLHSYNLFPVFVDLIPKLKSLPATKKHSSEHRVVRPNLSFTDSKIGFYRLRAKRFLAKKLMSV